MQTPYLEVLGGPPLHTLHTKGFMVVLSALVAYLNYPSVDPSGRVRQIPVNEIATNYDFIIVGAGSAGNVVANRLTEISNWNVLLIEAGGDETAQSDVPLLTRDMYNTHNDWNYTTVYQSQACHATNGICSWPTGRVLGGTSVLSDMMYVRGNRRDYDGWAALGNPGWSYNEVLPYFRLSEDNETPKYRADTMYHGVGGYLTVTIAPFLTPLARAYVQAGEQMGYPNIDYNAATQTGFMTPQATLRNGSRCSTAKAFLRPIRNRPNFFVSYYSQVTRILIGEVNKTSYGVQFVRDGQKFTVYANKEVIISSGTVNSAQLLLLSGVGPASQLKRFNIPIYANLPVGQRLLDHPGLVLYFQVNQSVTITRPVYENGTAILEYAQSGHGPLTDPLATETIGFANFPGANRSIDYPDVEFLMCSSLPDHLNTRQLFFIAALPLHPKSSGTITLKTSNPFDPPLIDPAYYSSEPDFANQIIAGQLAYNLSQTPALQRYGATLYLPFYPLCNNIAFLSVEFWTCMIVNYAGTVFHISGSNRMGPSTDTMAVVDNHLRVHGIKNLRVIDGSIMPTIVSSNTNAAIIMIGERGSAWIFQDHNVPNPSPPT